jgi:RHS repeat-associated protein
MSMTKRASTTAAGPQTINYDANGNRTTFSPYGSTDTYTTNNLNQYTNRNSSTANYDLKGNLATMFDSSTFVYDAQNRLITATKGGTSETFKYDGMNRQVSRQIGAGSPVYNVYDGWELIGEYAPGSLTPSNAYLSSTNGMVKNLATNQYYYQDALGSTTHLADGSGALLEWYRYDLQGTPYVNGDPNNHASAFGIRHLFTGQQWYGEIGVYDLRNRAYSPDIGRFLQPDPIRFQGDRTNLYRYVHNKAQKERDPLGLQGETSIKLDKGAAIEVETDVVEVNGSDVDGCSTDPFGMGGGWLVSPSPSAGSDRGALVDNRNAGNADAHPEQKTPRERNPNPLAWQGVKNDAGTLTMAGGFLIIGGLTAEAIPGLEPLGTGMIALGLMEGGFGTMLGFGAIQNEQRGKE